MDTLLVTKVILTIIGVVTSVYGAGYVIIGRMGIPFLPKRDSIIVGSTLLGVALALFIVSTLVP